MRPERGPDEAGNCMSPLVGVDAGGAVAGASATGFGARFRDPVGVALRLGLRVGVGWRRCLPGGLEGLLVARLVGVACLAAVSGAAFLASAFLAPDLDAALVAGLEAALDAGLALDFGAGFAAGFEPAFADDLEAVLGEVARTGLSGDLVTGLLEVTFLRLGIRREG